MRGRAEKEQEIDGGDKSVRICTERAALMGKSVPWDPGRPAAEPLSPALRVSLCECVYVCVTVCKSQEKCIIKLIHFSAIVEQNARNTLECFESAVNIAEHKRHISFFFSPDCDVSSQHGATRLTIFRNKSRVSSLARTSVPAIILVSMLRKSVPCTVQFSGFKGFVVVAMLSAQLISVWVCASTRVVRVSVSVTGFWNLCKSCISKQRRLMELPSVIHAGAF